MTTHTARHISISVERPPRDVYRFVSHVPNLPRWAHGLGTTVREVDGEWFVEGAALGAVKLRVAPPNDMGVLDHEVTLPSGERVLNQARVLLNGTGSEVVFTLFKLPGVLDEEFARDHEAVARDLATLKRLLETKS